jgi:hypothetical protein
MQIDNNQPVYEAQIQVPRCNSILKTGSHECQKLWPLHLDRCMGEHTDHSPKATHLSVCMLSSVWARSCFWIGVSIPHQIFPHLQFILLLLLPFLFLYFQRLHTSDNDKITYLVSHLYYECLLCHRHTPIGYQLYHYVWNHSENRTPSNLKLHHISINPS